MHLNSELVLATE